MAKNLPPKKSGKPPQRPAASRATQIPGRSSPPPVISGRWLLWALGITLAAAALCGYATFCLLFYQGQWQLILHPSRTIAATPASHGLQFDDIRFDYTETGSPRLDGWWIPAETDARWSAGTILYLHGGSGSLSDCVDDLATLHSLGINIFAFDYRGFGKSAGATPREQRMTEDADAAWTYLTETRHIPAKSIVVYGVGVAASLAADLAAKHPPAGLILDGPSESARKIIGADARSHIVPGFLITEHFDPTEPLQTLAVPKLFLDRIGMKPRTSDLYKVAALPKEYFELKPGAYEPTMRRFLDEVLP